MKYGKRKSSSLRAITSWTTRSKFGEQKKKFFLSSTSSSSVLKHKNFSYLFGSFCASSTKKRKHKIPSNWKNRENIFLLFAAKRYINIYEMVVATREKLKKKNFVRDLFNLIFGQSSSFAWLSSDAKTWRDGGEREMG